MTMTPTSSPTLKVVPNPRKNQEVRDLEKQLLFPHTL